MIKGLRIWTVLLPLLAACSSKAPGLPTGAAQQAKKPKAAATATGTGMAANLPDIDVGGYDGGQSDQSSGTTPADAPPVDGTPPPLPKRTGSSVGSSPEQRHDGTLSFQHREENFTLQLKTMVQGKEVASQNLSLPRMQTGDLPLPTVCVTGGKTCLQITILGEITQTLGSAECAEVTTSGATFMTITADTNGKGLIGTCLGGDPDERFTITCPQSTAIEIGSCSF